MRSSLAHLNLSLSRLVDRRRLLGALLAVTTALFLSPAAVVALDAAPELPLLSPAFSDQMVLQRDQPTRLWGWAKPGQSVTATLAGQSRTTEAGADGRWRLEVSPPAPGGPYTLSVATTGQTVRTLTDILVGDVWLCSGQSNMGWPVRLSDGGEEAAQLANPAWLRAVNAPARSAYGPELVPATTWQRIGPAEAPNVSAVAYFFAREWHAYTGVPVGLLQVALGGTPAESWVSVSGLANLPDFTEPLRQIKALHERGVTPTGSFLMHWLEDHDRGAAANYAWAQPGLPEEGWSDQSLPGSFSDLAPGPHPVVVWFRREIELPADFSPNTEVKLHLGSIEKMDTTLVNGRWVGASSWVENPRVYSVPPGTFKPGRNVLAIRVLRRKPDGGFLARPENFRLEIKGGASLPLAGLWRARISVDAKPPHPLPLDWENYPTMPAVLHQGMLAPYAPMSLAGALWYQGEANTSRADQYRRLLPALIADWRDTFQQPNLPIYIAGLPRFMGRRTTPGTDGWAELRDAQIATTRTVPGAYLATHIDLGNPDDIHPHDKAPVGQRLARLALREQLRVKVAAHSPRFVSATREGNLLRIQFSNTDGGLIARGGPLAEFAVAGADRVFHWADARVEGDTVILSSASVPEPVAARYAWQSNPDARLFNGAGLPAEPFRTDDWPLTSP